MSTWLWNKYGNLIAIFMLLFHIKNGKNDNTQHKYS